MQWRTQTQRGWWNRCRGCCCSGGARYPLHSHTHSYCIVVHEKLWWLYCWEVTVQWIWILLLIAIIISILIIVSLLICIPLVNLLVVWSPLLHWHRHGHWFFFGLFKLFRLSFINWFGLDVLKKNPFLIFEPLDLLLLGNYGLPPTIIIIRAITIIIFNGLSGYGLGSGFHLSVLSVSGSGGNNAVSTFFVG